MRTAEAYAGVINIFFLIWALVALSAFALAHYAVRQNQKGKPGW